MIMTYSTASRSPYDVERELRLLSREVTTAFNMVDFLRGIGERECSVLTIGGNVAEQEMLTLLQRVKADSGVPQAAWWPLVLIVQDSYVASRRALQSLAQVTLSQSATPSELIDAISQEVARAALKNVEYQLQSRDLSALLRGALNVTMHENESIRTVEMLAERVGVLTAALHHHWNEEGLHAVTGLTLRKFLEVVLLLKVRARMTPRIELCDAAKEYETTDKHTMKTYRRRVGPWRDRNRGGWLKLGRVVRSRNWSAPGPAA